MEEAPGSTGEGVDLFLPWDSFSGLCPGINGHDGSKIMDFRGCFARTCWN